MAQRFSDAIINIFKIAPTALYNMFPLCVEDMALMHITARELVAIGVNVIIIGPIFL